MIIDFLKLDIEKSDAEIALRILRQFKDCESGAEWLHVPFIAWAKLEQLEEFLDHIATGAELKEDTRRVLCQN